MTESGKKGITKLREKRATPSVEKVIQANYQARFWTSESLFLEFKSVVQGRGLKLRQVFTAFLRWFIFMYSEKPKICLADKCPFFDVGCHLPFGESCPVSFCAFDGYLEDSTLRGKDNAKS